MLICRETSDLPGQLAGPPYLRFASGRPDQVEPRPRTTEGFQLAREALAPDRCFPVGVGSDRYPVTDAVEAIGLRELAAELLARKPPVSAP